MGMAPDQWVQDRRIARVGPDVGDQLPRCHEAVPSCRSDVLDCFDGLGAVHERVDLAATQLGSSD
jgi:hypothetical protein